MKGYYQIQIRRAFNGAVRNLNFHNHILPGFYDIQMANSVADNKGTVIDTLAFGDGVGSHPDTATSFNGEKVFEKKYTTYIPPTNLSATSKETEFHHVLTFTTVMTESLRVGEIGVGAYVNSTFVLGSMVHIQDANGNPTSILLFPGDELAITWNLIIARPMVVPYRSNITQPELLTGNVAQTSYNTPLHTIDYEMFAAYPNWHLMGFNRILNLILERNAMITKTPWGWGNYNNSTGKYDPTTTPTFASLRQGAYLITDKTIVGYEKTRHIFIPNFVGPMRTELTRTDLDDWVPSVIKVTLSVDDLYSGWLAAFSSPDGNKPIPTLVNELDVTWVLVGGESTADGAQLFKTTIKTTPFIYITIYKNGVVLLRDITNEFGVFKFNDKNIKVNDVIMVRAHVRGHQQVREFTVTAPTTEPPGIVGYVGLTTSPRNEYADGSRRLQFFVRASLLKRKFRVNVTSVLVPVEGAVRNSVSISSMFINNSYGERYDLMYLDGFHQDGDKFTFKVVDYDTLNPIETYVFTVDGLTGTSTVINKDTATRDLLMYKLKVIPLS